MIGFTAEFQQGASPPFQYFRSWMGGPGLGPLRVAVDANTLSGRHVDHLPSCRNMTMHLLTHNHDDIVRTGLAIIVNWAKLSPLTMRRQACLS